MGFIKQDVIHAVIYYFVETVISFLFPVNMARSADRSETCKTMLNYFCQSRVDEGSHFVILCLLSQLQGLNAWNSYQQINNEIHSIQLF